MAKNEESKALVEKEAAGVPMTLDFTADAGQGFEDAGARSYAIPFLRILQKLSPQCDEDQPEFIEGARPGDFFNTVSEEVYAIKDGPIRIIPVCFRPVFNLWAQRNSGGGFKGSMSEAEGLRLLAKCSKNEKNWDITPDGNILSDTREHYVLIVLPDGRMVPALFALTSTQIKKSKKWMSKMGDILLPNGAKAPMFSQYYDLTTVTEENDQGSWKGVVISHAGPITVAEHYVKAKEFYEMIRAGRVEVQQPSDDEIPF